MQRTLSNLGMLHTDQDVTKLAGSHVQEVEVNFTLEYFSFVRTVHS